MKLTAAFFFIFCLFFLSSCKKGEDTSPQHFLTLARWKVTHVERSSYTEKHLDTVYTINSKSYLDTLSFRNDGSVSFQPTWYTIPVEGKWNYDDNTQILTTDLQVRVSSATGYGGPFYYYRSSKITELNSTNMTLEVTNSVTNFVPATGIRTEFTNVEKTFFVH